MDQLVNLLFHEPHRVFIASCVLVAAASLCASNYLRLVVLERDGDVLRQALADCMSTQTECNEGYRTFWFAMICLDALSIIFFGLSTPQLLLHLLRSMGFTRQGLDRRGRSVAYRLHRFAARRNWRWVLSAIGRLEVVGMLGWKLSTGLMLMFISTCIGYFVGKLANHVASLVV